MSRYRTALLLAILGVAAAFNLPWLRTFVEHARRDETASHIVLIPFVTAVLLYQQRRSIFARATTASWTGLPLIGAGVLILSAAFWTPELAEPERLSVTTAGVVVSFIGAFVVCYGLAAARSALFPLLFLAFAVPLPQAVLNQLIYLLKAGSAEAVAVLLQLATTPHYRDGFVFHLPNVTIEIADECSGIRSSIALFITTVLAGYQLFSQPMSRFAMVALVIPATILKNGIRIVSLSLLAVHVHPSFLDGRLHHDGGIVFFVLTLALLSPVVVLLLKFEARSRRAQSIAPAHASPERAVSTLQS